MSDYRARNEEIFRQRAEGKTYAAIGVLHGISGHWAREIIKKIHRMRRCHKDGIYPEWAAKLSPELLDPKYDE